LGLEPGEEDVADLVAEVEGDAAEEGGAGLAGAVDYRLDLGGVVVDARHQGRDQDAGLDAAGAQLGDRVEAGGGWFVTPIILAKAEYVTQRYRDFPITDIRNGGHFNGFMLAGTVAF